MQQRIFLNSNSWVSSSL